MLRHNLKNGLFNTLCSNETCVTRPVVAEKKVVDAKKSKLGAKPKTKLKAKPKAKATTPAITKDATE